MFFNTRVLIGWEPHACALKTTLKMNSELETLNFLQGLQHLNGILMDPMWNNYDKLFTYISQSLGQNLNLPPRGILEIDESLSSLFCGSQANGLQALFGLP